MKIWLSGAFIFLFCHDVYSASLFSDEAKPLSQAQVEEIGGIVQGNKIYSGDIIFDIDKLKLSGFQRILWPGGALIYEFEGQLTQSQRDAFISACKGWSTSTPAYCQQRTTELDYVYVVNHRGEKCGGRKFVSCSSIGKSGGKQELAIYETHWSIPYVIQHEMGHAFGMIHEQSRRDRDSFVFIQSQNIASGTEFNFAIFPEAATFSDYDYVSIMHYDNCAFSIKETQCIGTTPQYQTIVPKACHLDLVGGTSITTLDIEGMRRAYAPVVLALYDTDRKQACGTLDRHPKQIDLMCGENCGAVGPVQYSKIEHVYHNECGSFLPSRPDSYYQQFCTPLNKECAAYTWKHRALECLSDGIPATLHKLEVSCGCSHQTVNAKCTDYSKGINLARVEKLIREGDIRDQTMGKLVRRLIAWKEKGKIDEAIMGKLPEFLIKNHLKPSFQGNVQELHFLALVYVEWHSVFNKDFVLSMDNFKTLSRFAALDTSGM